MPTTLLYVLATYCSEILTQALTFSGNRRRFCLIQRNDCQNLPTSPLGILNNKQQSQIIRINSKYRQMAFRSVLVHLNETLEKYLFGPPGQMVTDTIQRASFDPYRSPIILNYGFNLAASDEMFREYLTFNTNSLVIWRFFLEIACLTSYVSLNEKLG